MWEVWDYTEIPSLFLNCRPFWNRWRLSNMVVAPRRKKHLFCSYGRYHTYPLRRDTHISTWRKFWPHIRCIWRNFHCHVSPMGLGHRPYNPRPLWHHWWSYCHDWCLCHHVLASLILSIKASHRLFLVSGSPLLLEMCGFHSPFSASSAWLVGPDFRQS